MCNQPSFEILTQKNMLETISWPNYVKILQSNFEELRGIFRDGRLDQGAHVGPEEKCSNLMFLLPLAYGQIK